MFHISIINGWYSLLNSFIVPCIIVCFMRLGILIRYGRVAVVYRGQYCEFIGVSFVFIKVFAILYCYISSKYSNHFLITTGLLLTAFLVISGAIMNKFYSIMRNRSISVPSFEKDKAFLIGTATVMGAVDFLITENQIGMFLIATILGKYFWFDSGLMPLKEMHQKILDDWNNANTRSKKESLVFAGLVLASDFLGNLFFQQFLWANSHSWSIIISAILGVIYCIICSFTAKMKKDKERKG